MLAGLTKKNLPNVLTVCRGILTLLMIVLFWRTSIQQLPWVLLLFIAASLTDWLDGSLARRWKVVSAFGQIFDPLFDKFLTFSLFFLLAPLSPDWLRLVFLLLVLRDLTTDAFKYYLLSQGQVTPAIFSAKLKTVCQMLMLVSLLGFLIWPSYILVIAVKVLAGLSVFWAYYSGVLYWKKFLKYFPK